jgi:hypothetical protein
VVRVKKGEMPLYLRVRKAHQRTLTWMEMSPITKLAPAMAVPHFKASNTALRSSLAGWGTKYSAGIAPAKIAEKHECVGRLQAQQMPFSGGNGRKWANF